MRTFQHLLIDQSILTESLKVTALSDPNLGLWKWDAGDSMTAYVLIDISEFNKTCKEWKSWNADSGSVIELQSFLQGVGHERYVLAAFSTGKQSQPCYKKSSIRTSSANKGYGPAMYELVMAYHHGMIPDRGSVSTQARKVWAKFKDRTDITSLELDDYEYPQTIDPQDDCPVHYDSVLDRAYLLSPADESKAKAIGDLAQKRGMSALRTQVTDAALAAKLIYENWSGFFDKKYQNREV